MQLQITVMPPNVTEAVVADEECEKAEFCPICSVQQPILKIFVRGLCEQSIFNLHSPPWPAQLGCVRVSKDSSQRKDACL